MNIKELKEAVESNNTDPYMVWSLADDSSLIVAEQYYKRIASDLGLTVVLISSYDEISDSLFGDDFLYVMKLNEKIELKPVDNLIVIFMPGVECPKDATVIPKLESWQLEDFLFLSLPGLKKESVKDLTRKYKTCPYGLLIASQRISEFDESDQQRVYEIMTSEGQFEDTSIGVFDLVDCLIKRNRRGVSDYIALANISEDDGLRVLSLARLKFRQILELQTNVNVTMESSGCKSEKQMWYMKNNVCNYYSNDELFRIYTMLCGTEYFWRMGKLELKDMLYYIVFNILDGGETYASELQ